MKPVPFAQYMERQRATAQRATEPLSWPPLSQKTESPAPARNSPLLRRVEAERAEAKASAPQRLEQGRLLAFEEGRESARGELEDERARMREKLEVEIAAARAVWVAEEAERLAGAHRAAFESFEMRCAQAVANILRPFTTQLVIGRVTEALVENLEVLFKGRSQALFEISGPVDLLDALRQKFASRDAAVVYKPDDKIDVCVRAGDTIIETQLGAWLKALGALLGDSSQETCQESGNE